MYSIIAFLLFLSNLTFLRLDVIFLSLFTFLLSNYWTLVDVAISWDSHQIQQTWARYHWNSLPRQKKPPIQWQRLHSSLVCQSFPVNSHLNVGSCKRRWNKQDGALAKRLCSYRWELTQPQDSASSSRLNKRAESFGYQTPKCLAGICSVHGHLFYQIGVHHPLSPERLALWLKVTAISIAEVEAITPADLVRAFHCSSLNSSLAGHHHHHEVNRWGW